MNLCLPICSLSCGSCSQRCCNLLEIHWSCQEWEENVFWKIVKKYFQIYYIWRKCSDKFCLPGCSLSCGSCSQTCFNSLKNHSSCQVWEKDFIEIAKKYFHIVFSDIIFLEHFAHLAAPYRAAAAAKGDPTHWKYALRGGRNKCSEKLWTKYSEVLFLENFLRNFCLLSCSLSCGSCSQTWSNSLTIHWSYSAWEENVFWKIGEKIFSDI